MQLILNGNTYYIDEGSTLTENYNETLDSANIRISHITQANRIDIQPFDDCILRDENGRFSDRYMCVNTYTETQESLDNITYSYSIQLFSQTKKLEGIILPNLSITHYKNLKQRSIFHFLRIYNELYGKGDFTFANTITNGVYSGTVYFFTTTSAIEEITKTLTVTNVPQGATVGDYKIVMSGQNDYTYDLKSITIGNRTPAGEVSITFTLKIKANAPISSSFGFYWYLCDKKWVVDCPEMQWNAPTLRSVLNDLMMVNDCICIVRNNEIDFIDLTKKNDNIRDGNTISSSETYHETGIKATGSYNFTISVQSNQKISIVSVSGTNGTVVVDNLNPFTGYVGYSVVQDGASEVRFDIGYKVLTIDNKLSYINYITRSQSSNDYASEIRMDLQNVLQSSVEGVKDSVETTEFISLTTNENIITSKNIILKTQFPIYSIKKIYFVVVAFTQANKRTFIKYDISDYVVEHNEFITLPIYYRTADKKAGVKYQNETLYYTRGQNSIEGFSDEYKYGLILTGTTWELIRKEIYKKFEDDTGIVLGELSIQNPWFSPVFQIEYTTTYNLSFSASKREKTRNKRVIIDNQTNSYVDATRQGELTYQKANRLSNQSAQINQRVFGNNYIKIGDYLDSEIVYQTEYQIYKNHTEVNAIAVKDYILQNYFTSVNSKIRTWVNAKNEAFIRNELKKVYCVFSYNRNETTPAYDVDASYFFNCLTTTNVKPIKYAIIKSDMSLNYYSLNCVVRVLGNSMVISCGFDDNYYAGKNINSDIVESSDYSCDMVLSPAYIRTPVLSSESVGGIPYQNLGYTNANGELGAVKISYCNTIDYSNGTVSPLPINNLDEVGDNSEMDTKRLYQAIMKKPVIDVAGFEDYVKLEEEYVLNKDNKEIPMFNTQYEFLGDDDIVINGNFAKIQEAVRDTAHPSGILVWSSNEYNLHYIPGNAVLLDNITLTLTRIVDSQYKLEFNGVSNDDKKYMYVCDYENRLLFTAKQRNKLYFTIKYNII